MPGFRICPRRPSPRWRAGRPPRPPRRSPPAARPPVPSPTARRRRRPPPWRRTTACPRTNSSSPFPARITRTGICSLSSPGWRWTFPSWTGWTKKPSSGARASSITPSSPARRAPTPPSPGTATGSGAAKSPWTSPSPIWTPWRRGTISICGMGRISTSTSLSSRRSWRATTGAPSIKPTTPA